MLPDEAFKGVPDKLIGQLMHEYGELLDSFAAGRWRYVGLNAGRFCEIAYCIINGFADGDFPASAAKPSDFVTACRALEKRTELNGGLRFIAPRILSAIYELRVRTH